MKKFLGDLVAMLTLSAGVAGVALAQDNQPTGPGTKAGSCVTCHTTLTLSGYQAAVCAPLTVHLGYGYRSCTVITNYPGGNQHCSLGNFGACSASSGGGGGGFIA